MAKLTNPITLSEHLEVDPARIEELGVLDVTLAIDTNLFIDPLLLEHSRHAEIRTTAVRTYREYFERIISLLIMSGHEDDVPWRNAVRQLSFREISATCLGYGKASTDGSAFGPYLTNRIAITGKRIVELGVRDPNVFIALALFEEGIGADRISDMATGVILPALLAFNHRIIAELELPTQRHTLKGNATDLVTNPYASKRNPVLLTPGDVLRPLPIASDWEEVIDSASQNDEVRARVNAHIGAIWEAKTRKGKAQLRAQALQSKEAFQTLLDAIYSVEPSAYNVAEDPSGILSWTKDARSLIAANPLLLRRRDISSAEDAIQVVEAIVDQFKFLIELRGLWKSLYHDEEPHHESYAQRSFFTVAYSYCKAHNLDLTPEADTGTGRIDFKISHGFNARVLVEIKLSTNRKVVEGYTEQLRRYTESEEAIAANYVVLDVGRMHKKDQLLVEARNQAAREGKKLSRLVFVDALPKLPASQLG